MLSFQKPTIEEIRIHMKARKPEWPDKFIEYWAEKFWNHYQAQGWKISNNVAMKDWHAAFASRWQKPKYKEDIEFLEKIQPRKEPIKHPGTIISQDRTIEYLDDILMQYQKHPTYIPMDRLASCYDWLKQQGIVKMILNAEQKRIAIEAATIDIQKGKAIAVQLIFDQMALRLKTFAELFTYAK